MIWRTLAHRAALLELLALGSLRRRQGQAAAFDALAELPWTRRTGRRDELVLVPERRADLVALLDRVWLDWHEVLDELRTRDLTPTPDGLAALADARRAAGLPDLPDRLNRRTAASLVAPHSKSALTERRTAALGETAATHDGVVRVRPPAGLRATSPRGNLDLAAVASVLGEVALPERALRAGLTFAGELAGVLLVENLGAYCDLPTVDGWLVAHVPGWDTATVAVFLAHLPPCPVLHFGDLDPAGARIVRHLQGLAPSLAWFVPDFWAEELERRALPCTWPADLDLSSAPPLVRTLAARGAWLEQEAIVLDPRLPLAIVQYSQNDSRGAPPHG